MPPAFAVPPRRRAPVAVRLGDLALELAEIFALLVFLVGLACVAAAFTGGA